MDDHTYLEFFGFFKLQKSGTFRPKIGTKGKKGYFPPESGYVDTYVHDGWAGFMVSNLCVSSSSIFGK